MATNHTENYGLCQWEAADPFVRTDFNADNAKLDAALALAAEMARRCDAALPQIGYDLTNLLLQREHENKYTGWKRGLLFSAFRDQEEIDQRSDGLVWRSGQILVDTKGLKDYATPHRQGVTLTVNAGAVKETNWIPSGNTTLNSITVYAKCLSSGATVTGTAKLEILLDEVLVASSTATVTGEFTGTTFPFSCDLAVNRRYTIRYTALTVDGSLNKGQQLLECNNSNDHFAYSTDCDPRTFREAWMTTHLADVGLVYDRALLWVRHTGAAPAVQLRGSGEADWRPFAQGEGRPSPDRNGNDNGYTETAYVLEGEDGPGAALRFQLSASTTLREYGVVFL